MDSVTTVATVLIRAGGGGTAVFLVYGLVDLPCVRLFPVHAGGYNCSSEMCDTRLVVRARVREGETGTPMVEV